MMRSQEGQRGSARRRKVAAAAIWMGVGATATYAQEATPSGVRRSGAEAPTAPDDSVPAPEEPSNFHVSGYVRTWASFNLQNVPETPQNDRWDASMLRGSIMLDADWKTGPLTWKAVGRADREIETGYMRRLQNEVRTNSPGGPGSDMRDLYNQVQLREFYADFSPFDRVKMRLGKQQVVWGESDFFQAMDVVQGYDYRWRFFLEREGDELRKSLIMANAKIDVPEANGSLQVLFRPGWDKGADIGNTYDLSGGRWALQPNKGIDLLSPGFLRNDYHHPDADIKDPTGGLRWTGDVGSLNYSLAWLRTFNNDPIVNSAFAPNEKTPSGQIGDFIHPKVDLFGLTMNGYVQPIDAVLSTEITYTKDAPYNIGTNFLGGALPGFDGIKKKNVVKSMLRVDKNLNLQPWLGTSRPSFFSVQVFDTWIQSFKKSDDLVELAGFGAPVKEHTTLLTVILGLNYSNDKINPGLAMGTDLSNGGGFVSPSVDFSWGDHWRFKVEGDFFFAHSQKQPGQVEEDTHLFGYLAHNDQLMFRLTRQF